VISDAPQIERIVALVDTIAAVCDKHGKELVIRTFAHSPAELDWLGNAFQQLAEKSEHKHVLKAMSKCVPHDWQPFYPHNKFLGHVGGLPQIVELDLGAEFYGHAVIPNCHPEYIRYRMEYAREKNVMGAVARIGRQDHHAHGTPNEVNIWALMRLCEDANYDVETIWDEWTEKTYGKDAAPHMKAALKRTFEMCNLLYFAKGEWYVNHTRPTGYGYAVSHLHGNRITRWEYTPTQYVIEEELCNPGVGTVQAVMGEKLRANEIAQEAWADIEKAKEFLTEEQFAELAKRWDNLVLTIEAFARNVEIIWGCLHMERIMRTGEQEMMIPQAIMLVQGARERLRILASEVEEKQPDAWPCTPENLLKVADDKKLDEIIEEASPGRTSPE